MNALWTTFTCIALLASSANAADNRWTLSSGGGIDSNPAGFNESDSQALGWTKLKTVRSVEYASGTVRFDYTGIAYSFLPNSTWSAHRHAVSAIYAATASADFRYEYGAKVTGSWNHPNFASHSYREIEGRGTAWSKIIGWNVKTALKLGIRSYPDSPEFNYRGATIDVSTRRTLKSRTTIGGQVEWATRTYTTQTIEDVLDGVVNAQSSRFRVDAFLGQGLTSSTGLRLSAYAQNGNGRSRWRDDYWQVLDDPLATSGVGGRFQLSWLAPAGHTVRAYTEVDALDESYISSDGAYALRSDERLGGGVALQGSLPWLVRDNRTSYTVDFGTERIWSTDPSYAYEQYSVMLGLMYAW